jgi:DNA repair protein RadA/Sms
LAKKKTTFVCQSCGNQSAKWLGKCPHCSSWNSFVEEIVSISPSKSHEKNSSRILKKPKSLNEVEPLTQKRLVFSDNELNRVLGGGAIPGSLILFGGEPGIGKSTLMLQLALSNPQFKVLYVSGEESDEQIKTRADRVQKEISNNIFILTETDTTIIKKAAENIQPDILIIDSIQTLHSDNLDSAPGTVSQIRECTFEILAFAKSSSLPTFIIGHINKEGSLAGPKVLEHMVDTVLQFEGDRNHFYRIVRSIKNRFGSTNELGIYEMLESGLKPVNDPSKILISIREEDLSGIAIAANIEGVRPLMIETQALVSRAAYGTPQRSTTGFDSRRMNMLLAVLEKKCGFKVGMEDIFLNITGGIKIEDPASDLAILAAIVSSREDISIPSKICFAGEVGLSGEVRPVQKILARIIEAQKLGFEKIYISEYNDLSLMKNIKKINIFTVKKIEEVFRDLFS